MTESKSPTNHNGANDSRPGNGRREPTIDQAKTIDGNRFPSHGATMNDFEQQAMNDLSKDVETGWREYIDAQCGCALSPELIDVLHHAWVSGFAYGSSVEARYGRESLERARSATAEAIAACHSN